MFRNVTSALAFSVNWIFYYLWRPAGYCACDVIGLRVWNVLCTVWRFWRYGVYWFCSALSSAQRPIFLQFLDSPPHHSKQRKKYEYEVIFCFFYSTLCGARFVAVSIGGFLFSLLSPVWVFLWKLLGQFHLSNSMSIWTSECRSIDKRHAVSEFVVDFLYITSDHSSLCVYIRKMQFKSKNWWSWPCLCHEIVQGD